VWLFDLTVPVTILRIDQDLEAHEMRKLTPIVALYALTVVPSMVLAQSCRYAEISQEFSQADTLNSAGAPIGEAYAVFQQDRFYVNAQNLRDPADVPDAILVTREARAAYGQAVAAFFRAEGRGDLTVSDLIGRHYIVSIEACGPADNPTIQIQSIQLDQGNLAAVEPNAAVALLDQREMALVAREQQVAQRETELGAWQAELEERERMLAEQTQNLAQAPAVQPVPTNEPAQEVSVATPPPATYSHSNSCLADVASLGSLISLSLCAGMMNQASSSFGEPDVFPDFLNSDIKNLFWQTDQNCGYLPIVNDALQAFDGGRMRVSFAIISQNFAEVGPEMGRCNTLIEHHLGQ
jgi:hypothetical protein